VCAIELTLDAHALVERQVSHRLGAELENLVATAGEARSRRLPLLAPLPLPHTEAHEERGEQQREQGEAQCGREHPSARERGHDKLLRGARTLHCAADMQHIVWLLVLACLLGILISLGLGLYHLSRGTPQDSARLARALTVRIAVSLLLFALLMLAWYFGLIRPHALQGGGTPH